MDATIKPVWLIMMEDLKNAPMTEEEEEEEQKEEERMERMASERRAYQEWCKVRKHMMKKEKKQEKENVPMTEENEEKLKKKQKIFSERELEDMIEG